MIGARRLALLAVVWTLAACAEAYEVAYGNAASSELAFRGVTPVSRCPDGGSIAVGASVPAPPVARVYVVRAAPNGTRIWERFYDFAPGSAQSVAESVVESRDGRGFVIAGSTRSPGTGYDAFLLKIDCNGNVLWSQTYLTAEDDGARDVIEARTGDSTAETQPGDLVVAGYSVEPGAGQKALLFRTTAAGDLIWNRRYPANGTATLNTLTEVRPFGTASTGDIVAAGSLHVNSTERAYVMRVDGNTGHIGGSPRCVRSFGGMGHARFDAVVERWPGVVYVGSTRASANGAADIFAVRSPFFACEAAVVRRITHSLDASISDVAYDVQVLPQPLTLAPAGSLVITGRTGRFENSGTDAFVLAIDDTQLKPLHGTGRLFGGHANGRTIGHSLATLPDGLLLAGVQNAAGGRADLYLARTRSDGRTSCSTDWPVDWTPLNAAGQALASQGQAVLQTVFRVALATPLSTGTRLCP